MKKSNLAKAEVEAVRELVKKLDVQGCSALKGKKKGVRCGYTR